MGRDKQRKLQCNLDLTNLYFTKVLGITNCFLQLGQNYSQLNGTEPRLNEPRFNEIIVITNTIQMRNRKIYLDETNKCQHVIKDES